MTFISVKKIRQSVDVSSSYVCGVLSINTQSRVPDSRNSTLPGKGGLYQIFTSSVLIRLALKGCPTELFFDKSVYLLA